MATLIQAVQEFGPQIVRGKTVQQRELLKLLSRRTGVHESEILSVLTEMRDAIIFFLQAGRGVKLQGIGTYLPYMKIDGRVRVSYRLGTQIRHEINDALDFQGEIKNRENIGKSTDELITLWNEAYPDNPVQQ